MNGTQDRLAISVAQLGVVAANPDRNLATAKHALEGLPRYEQQLIVFPECFLTGYVTSTPEETASRAISLDHPVFDSLRQLSRDTGTHLVVGFLERSTNAVFNSTVLTTPGGELHRYRKQHLLKLGADAFAAAGGVQNAVVDLEFGRTGMMICYDLRLPETARRLALEGADVIAMPTNWPATATILADHFARVRAAENGVYLAIANRPDSEAGIQFLGRSQVIDPKGEVLLDAGIDEGVFTVLVDISLAAEKQRVVSAGNYEFNLFSDRRPELYGLLSEDHPSTLE